MANLSKKIQDFAHQKGLFRENQKILVGVSGGADSVCLLSILLELRKKYKFSLHVAHVNYNLREEDSKKDQFFVENLAKINNLGLSILTINKPIKSSNLENELRDIRYKFFEKERKRLKFDVIAVAHNQDDQAETVLYRVLRGSGLLGVSAMKPKSENIIRPLLSLSREDIENYLKENKIKFRTDKTNLKPIFERNKIRLKLIPYLEKNYNPNIKETLSRLAESSGSDYDYISSEAKRKLKMTVSGDGKIMFSAFEMMKMHPAIYREALRCIIKLARKDIVDIDLGNINEIEKILKSKKNKVQKVFFKGLKIEKRGAIVTILFDN